jgi:hypothetical protein
MKHAVVVTTAAVWLVMSAPAGAQETPATTGTTRQMDIVVTRYLVDASGQHSGPPAQTVRYRIARIQTNQGWHTIMTLGAPDAASPEAQARNPFLGGRLEIDHAGAFTMFDNQGREIRLPDRPGSLATTLTDRWSESLEHIDTSPATRRARVQEVEAKYGRPAGRIRGLNQYLRKAGDDVEELLFDDVRSVPVELNIMRHDVLHGHVAFEYAGAPGGRLHRRRTRSEARVTNDGHRMVTVAEFSNIAGER